MKRSGFKKTSGQLKRSKGLKRSPFKKTASKTSNEKLEKPKRLNPIGKRTSEWADIRAKLKSEFLSAGITHCEIQIDSACRKHVDGFAHLLKRRNMGKWGSAEREANLMDVVAACNYCHDKVEMLGEEKMSPILQSIIDQRKARLAKWKKI